MSISSLKLCRKSQVWRELYSCGILKELRDSKVGVKVNFPREFGRKNQTHKIFQVSLLIHQEKCNKILHYYYLSSILKELYKFRNLSEQSSNIHLDLNNPFKAENSVVVFPFLLPFLKYWSQTTLRNAKYIFIQEILF